MTAATATPSKRRRNAVITALVLAAMALGIYLTLIAEFVAYR